MENIKIDKNIFRGYDIRGVYPTTINEKVAELIGEGFGSYIQEIGKKQCIVGYDNRISSPSLYNSLIRGILKTGVDVISLGLVTTPMYYYASIYYKISPGVMITASHNPKDDNGFKIAFDESGNAKGDEIQDFYRYIIKGKFFSGTGILIQKSIEEAYANLMKASLSFGDRRLKVVLDPGNGTTSIIAKKIYELFPIDVVMINDISDGTFPNHHPDPCVEKNLEQLKQKVKEEKADLGLAFDGDGDRVGVVDENGDYIPTDKYMIIIIRNLVEKVRHKAFLYDVKCSRALEDEIKKLGAKPICYRTGNSYTKAKVRELDLPFGGELSGHVYFRDRFLGFDSGLYAGLRLVELLSYTQKKVSQLLEDIPIYVSTEELKFAFDDEAKFDVVNRVLDYASSKGYKINNIDGVRVDFDDGWALIRVSNTGPNVTARFEAKTEKKLEKIQKEFLPLIEIEKPQET